MDSIKNIFKIGNGPSSSHTMGPSIAAKRFLDRNMQASRFHVELFGSLALTGKGHLTDVTIANVLGNNRTTIEFNFDVIYSYHPNAMKFTAYKNEEVIDTWLVFSVGGGSLKELDEARNTSQVVVYPHNCMMDIILYCQKEHLSFTEYVDKFDPCSEYLYGILEAMKQAIKRGTSCKGHLPGKLNVARKANMFLNQALSEKSFTKLIYAYSLATAEENASGGVIVTSPTCGSSGVLAGALIAYSEHYNVNDDALVNALKVAGLFGNIIKFNGSISGAEVGCQGEVGAACSMSAAAITYLIGGSNEQIEYAAEIGLEHHLGLTCDPVDGLVQIPCIERNALASAKAIDIATYSKATDGIHHITFDSVVEVMRQTGIDLKEKYKETSIGGLASCNKC